jgi:hypothetical protein
MLISKTVSSSLPSLNLPLGVGKEMALCCRVVCLCVLGWVCGPFIGFGFCLDYFEGCFSWVFLGFLGFFSLGLGGPIGGFWG